MILNRQLQLEILEVVSKSYPHYMQWSSPALVKIYAEFDSKLVDANATYLIEHGLICTSPSPKRFGFNYGEGAGIKITVKGLDFLEQDGGLSAILGTVTVKLHADTIRDLLETRIMESQLPVAEKKRFVDQLKELPGEALKTLTNKLIEKACDNPEVVVSVFNSML